MLHNGQSETVRAGSKLSRTLVGLVVIAVGGFLIGYLRSGGEVGLGLGASGVFVAVALLLLFLDTQNGK